MQLIVLHTSTRLDDKAKSTLVSERCAECTLLQAETKSCGHLIICRPAKLLHSSGPCQTPRLLSRVARHLSAGCQKARLAFRGVLNHLPTRLQTPRLLSRMVHHLSASPRGDVRPPGNVL